MDMDIVDSDCFIYTAYLLFDKITMSEIKVNLSITLQGRVLMSEQECSKNPNNYDYHSMLVESTVKIKKGKKVDKELIKFRTRKSIPASQSINISKEAYEYYISKECPEFSKPKYWQSMSKKMRLEAHLAEITKGLNGIRFTYQVFED